MYTLRQIIGGETNFIAKFSKYYENLIYVIVSKIITLRSVELFP